VETASQEFLQRYNTDKFWSNTSSHQVVVRCLFVERKQPGWESRAVWLGLCLLYALTLALLYFIIPRGLWLQVSPCVVELLYAPLASFALKVFPVKDTACHYFKFCSV